MRLHDINTPDYNDHPNSSAHDPQQLEG